MKSSALLIALLAAGTLPALAQEDQQPSPQTLQPALVPTSLQSASDTWDDLARRLDQIESDPAVRTQAEAEAAFPLNTF